MLERTTCIEDIEENLAHLQLLIEQTTSLHLLIRNRIEVLNALSIPLLGNPIIRLQSDCIELEYQLRLELEHFLTYAEMLADPTIRLDQSAFHSLILLNANVEVLEEKLHFFKQSIQSTKMQSQIINPRLQSARQ